MNDKKKTREADKKSSRGVIVGACICAGICLILILALVLAEPIGAWRLRSDVLERLEIDGELRVVLSDPLQGGEGLFSSAQALVEGEDARLLAAELGTVLENSSYEEVERVQSGLWLPQAAVYADGALVARLYLEEDGICLEKNGKKISFEVSDADESSYEALYRRILAMLGNAH